MVSRGREVEGGGAAEGAPPGLPDPGERSILIVEWRRSVPGRRVAGDPQRRTQAGSRGLVRAERRAMG